MNPAGGASNGDASAADRGALLDELEGKLRAFRDPDSGEQIVKDVYRADAIYHGPLRPQAPDLLVMPCDGYDIKGTFDATVLTGRGPLVGMHKYDNATLFVRGHRIEVDHASVHDVLPTACRLLALECPPAVDGRAVVS